MIVGRIGFCYPRLFSICNLLKCNLAWRQYSGKKIFSFDYIWQLEVWVITFSYLTIMPRSRGTNFSKLSAQPAFTCSKLTIETLEQGVKYVQS